MGTDHMHGVPCHSYECATDDSQSFPNSLRSFHILDKQKNFHQTRGTFCGTPNYPGHGNEYYSL